MYKKWRRNRIHEKLKSQIEYNKKRINSFMNIDDDRAEILVTSTIEICYVYDREYLDKVIKKYNVDKKLVNESIRTSIVAKDEFNMAKKRYYKYSKKVDERVKVDLYKKAILELKSEGLLN